jgi:SAM-dependent methyltransferase
MTNERLESFRRLGAAFAAGGERYDRLRPGYPDRAVTWLVEGTLAAGVVVDIGAGTGKLTVALLAHGFAVIAVDPSQDMLAQLSRQLPTVQTQVGTGEAAGLPDHTADLITFAQSWHWVEPTAGSTETARILKPGGKAGWVWNFLDVGVAWVAELAEIWHTVAGEGAVDATRHAPVLGSAFGPVDAITFDWADTMPVVDLAELVTTRSYYLNASEQKQQQVRDQVTAFIAAQFQTPAPLISHTELTAFEPPSSSESADRQATRKSTGLRSSRRSGGVPDNRTWGRLTAAAAGPALKRFRTPPQP